MKLDELRKRYARGRPRPKAGSKPAAEPKAEAKPKRAVSPVDTSELGTRNALWPVPSAADYLGRDVRKSGAYLLALQECIIERTKAAASRFEFEPLHSATLAGLLARELQNVMAGVVHSSPGWAIAKMREYGLGIFVIRLHDDNDGLGHAGMVLEDKEPRRCNVAGAVFKARDHYDGAATLIEPADDGSLEIHFSAKV